MGKRYPFYRLIRCLLLFALLALLPVAVMAEDGTGLTAEELNAEEIQMEDVVYIPGAESNATYYYKFAPKEDVVVEIDETGYYELLIYDENRADVTREYFDHNTFDTKYYLDAKAGKTYYFRFTVYDEDGGSFVLHKNWIQKITYVPAKDSMFLYEYYEDCNGFIDHPIDENGFETSETFFHYLEPYQSLGDKMTITYDNGKTVTYVYDDEILGFKYRKEVIPYDDVEISSNQKRVQWAVGKDNRVTISYKGCVGEYPVNLKTNPVRSIYYEPSCVNYALEYKGSMQEAPPDPTPSPDPPAPDGSSRSLNTSTLQSEEGMYFHYDEPEFNHLDKLTVTYIDDSQKTFVYDKPELMWMAPDGSELELDSPVASSDQMQHHWYKGSPDNYMYVMYMGRTSNQVPVEIRKNLSYKKLAKMTLSKKDYNYDGGYKTPAVTVTYDGVKLKEGEDYTVEYGDNKNIGLAYVSVEGTGEYGGDLFSVYNIHPKGTTLTKPASKSKSIVVKWKKQASKMATPRITGYQIQVSTSSSFKASKTKTYKVKGYAKTSYTAKKLKSGKKYYIRIRTYRAEFYNVKYRYIYSDWSKVRTAKAK